MNFEYDQDNHVEIKDLLLGRRIVSVTAWLGTTRTDPYGILRLDDGTELELRGHDGGCACSSGCYPLTSLASLGDVDNVITNVEFEDDPGGVEYPDGEGVYRIFVYADNVKVNLATFEGTDGNGFYGTGYHIRVCRP